MDLSPTDEQREIFADAERFARARMEGDVAARDRDGRFHRLGWQEASAYGLAGLHVAERWGGLGFDLRTALGVLEAVGRGCTDNGLLFSLGAHLWTAVSSLDAFGTDAQKDEFLRHLTSGRGIGANAITEPAAGSDAFSLRTTAAAVDGGYVLHGAKTFVTNAPVADLFIVYARVVRAGEDRGITAFLLPRCTPGLTVGPALAKMGMRTSPMAEVFLEGCEVPDERRLGREGAGRHIFAHAMTLERGGILAPAVGAMDRLLRRSIDHARSREQFGQPIGRFQMVSSRVVDMHLRLDTSRSALARYACRRDEGRQAALEAAVAKLQISEAWIRTCEDAIRVFGGSGYMVEMQLEREHRDAMGSCLYSGTNDLQRRAIAGLLGLPV